MHAQTRCMPDVAVDMLLSCVLLLVLIYVALVGGLLSDWVFAVEILFLLDPGRSVLLWAISRGSFMGSGLLRHGPCIPLGSLESPVGNSQASEKRGRKRSLEYPTGHPNGPGKGAVSWAFASPKVLIFSL